MAALCAILEERIIYWFVLERDFDDRKRSEALIARLTHIASIAIERTQAEEVFGKVRADLMPFGKNAVIRLETHVPLLTY